MFSYNECTRQFYYGDSNHATDSVPTVQIGLKAIPSETLRYVKSVKLAIDEAESLGISKQYGVSVLYQFLPTKITAIKRVKDDVGCSLRDAKEFVEFVWEIM